MEIGTAGAAGLEGVGTGAEDMRRPDARKQIVVLEPRTGEKHLIGGRLIAAQTRAPVRVTAPDQPRQRGGRWTFSAAAMPVRSRCCSLRSAMGVDRRQIGTSRSPSTRSTCGEMGARGAWHVARLGGAIDVRADLAALAGAHGQRQERPREADPAATI
jgi:hypothetical protein